MLDCHRVDHDRDLQAPLLAANRRNPQPTCNPLRGAGQSRTVELIPLAGARKVYGFTGAVMGKLK